MGEVIRKRNSKGAFIGYYVRYYENGARKTRATKATSAAEARRMLAEIEARIGRGRLGVPDQPQHLAVPEVVTRFLDEYEPSTRNRDRWAQTTRYELAPVLPLLGHGAVSADDAKKLVRRLSSTHKPRSIVRKLAMLKMIYKWALRRGLVPSNPFEDVKPPRVEATVEYLSSAEVKALIAAADARSDLRGSMLPVAVRLGIYAGLRCGEIFGLRWRDIDMDRGVLVIRQSYRGAPTKSGKVRTIPIADDLAAALTAWRTQCPHTDAGLVCPVLDPDGRWIAARRRPCLKTTYRHAGLTIPKSPWHVLRHSFASHYLMKGGSLIALQTMLGHSSLKITAIYSHMSSEHLRAEIHRLKF
ncbi:MAG: tyrosine-type recombinase/integrase [Myxococcales bacterium]|nr:tyrosine-type recombinase/integrase [Myxococcales bacterium]